MSVLSCSAVYRVIRKARIVPSFLPILLLFTFPPAQAETLSLDEHDYDARNGKEINELCAGCHGEHGEGGGDGEYPRLAGLPAKYLVAQLREFMTRERHSIAMSAYATERELPDPDLLDISIYLSKIELLTKMPTVDPDMEAYERLMIAKQVMNVARYEGDSAAGMEIYRLGCRKCHGADGKGRGSTPMLSGQYSEYIRLQIDHFLNGVRANPKMSAALGALSAEDIDNLLAYLSIADD